MVFVSNKYTFIFSKCFARIIQRKIYKNLINFFLGVSIFLIHIEIISILQLSYIIFFNDILDYKSIIFNRHSVFKSEMKNVHAHLNLVI